MLHRNAKPASLGDRVAGKERKGFEVGVSSKKAQPIEASRCL